MKTFVDNIKAVLAITVVLCGFAYFFITYFVGKAQSDPQIIIAIVGAMTTVLAYYFGSASGNSQKDKVIADIAANTTQPTVMQTGNDPTVIQSTKE